MYLINMVVIVVLFTAPKINIQTPPKSPQQQLTDYGCDMDPNQPLFMPSAGWLAPPPHYSKSINHYLVIVLYGVLCSG